MRNAAWVVAVAILFLSGVIGVTNGPREFQGARNALQLSVALGVTLYGVAGLLAGYGLARRRLWSIRATEGWGAIVTYVSTVASFAFSGPEVSATTKAFSAVFAGVATALIAAFIVWTARSATRPSLPPGDVPDNIPTP
jgi:hypothetical protein